MDPLTIVSLVANIGQFVDFTGKLISKSVEIYGSAEGVLVENTEIEATVNDLVRLKLSDPHGVESRLGWCHVRYDILIF